MDKTIEERLAKIETDIVWIKATLQEIKTEKETNKRIWIAVLGSMITSLTAIIIAVLR